MIKKNTVFLNGRKIGTYEFFQKAGSGHINFNGFDPYEANLADDQQVVLEWLKREHFDSYIKSVLSNLYFYVNMTAIGDLENKEIQEMVNAYEKLSQEDFAQVLKVFSQWALEQEGEG